MIKDLQEKKCSVINCDNKHKSKGYCGVHYMRFSRYGDANISKHHGYTCSTNSKKKKLYRAWRSIKNRCYNSKVPEYRHYGARGIILCEEWKNDFFTFAKYIGLPPTERHWIERINNNNNYEPGNVKWVLPKDNCRNRRNNVLNEDLVYVILDYLKKVDLKVTEIAKILEINIGTIHSIKYKKSWLDIIEKYERTN